MTTSANLQNSAKWQQTLLEVPNIETKSELHLRITIVQLTSTVISTIDTGVCFLMHLMTAHDVCSI